jgi:glutathione S-transferase
LVDHYGAGRLIPPANTPQRLRYTYWLHYAEGSAMPPLLLKLVCDRIANSPAPWPISVVARRIAGTVVDSFVGPQLKLHLDYMESELAAHPWFAGEEFTAADVQMSFPLEAAALRAGLSATRPHLMNFLERIHARDAYKRALERGGPYSF